MQSERRGAGTVIGIDPGVSKGVAWAAWDCAQGRLIGCGTLKPRPPGNLLSYYDRAMELFRELAPFRVAIEAQYVPVRRDVASTALAAMAGAATKLSFVSGLLAAAAHAWGAEVVTVAPTRWKHAATGRGGASKAEVQDSLLSVAGRRLPSDQADALGIALAAANQPEGGVPCRPQLAGGQGGSSR